MARRDGPLPGGDTAAGTVRPASLALLSAHDDANDARGA